MTKIDLSIELIENGILLTVNGKKYINRNYNELGRRLMKELDPAFIPMKHNRIIKDRDLNFTAGRKKVRE